MKNGDSICCSCGSMAIVGEVCSNCSRYNTISTGEVSSKESDKPGLPPKKIVR